MAKFYKSYKERIEELEKKHNVKINLRIIFITNIITLLISSGVFYFFYSVSKQHYLNQIKSLQGEKVDMSDTKKLKSPVVYISKKSNIQKDNFLLRSISPVMYGKLYNWLKIWQEVVPVLEFENFTQLEQKNLVVDNITYILEQKDFARRKKFLSYSPDKSKAIDPFFGRIDVSINNCKIDFKFDSSGVVQLISLSNNTYQIIEVYGPSYDYDEVFWVNDNIFVLAGSEIKYFSEQPVSYVRIPKISIYNLEEKKVISYYGIGTEEETYQEYIKPKLLSYLYARIVK